MLRGKVGDTLEITISSGEGAEHDIVFPELGVASKKFDGKSGAVTLSVKLTQSGSSATSAPSPATARSAWKACWK